MQPQAPFCREAGAGTSVVCLHSGASSSGQWRALMDRLGRRFRVIAVDLYGSGKTVAWPQDKPMHLDDEIALLRSVFQAAGDRFHLVGHSYGGAIALKAALTHQDRLISLALYEPVLFSVLMANAPQATRQIRRASEAGVSRSGDDVGEQMFVGHIGMGLALKRAEPRLNLGAPIFCSLFPLKFVTASSEKRI